VLTYILIKKIIECIYMLSDIIHVFARLVIYSYTREELQTYENGDLLVRLGKRIGGGALPEPYDESAIDCSTEEGVVGVPPQGAFLPGDVELVGEVAVRPDGALGDHRHPVVPTVSQLIHAWMNENRLRYMHVANFEHLRIYT
jgi:hypothetical protein